jgi:hypothetical protein
MSENKQINILFDRLIDAHTDLIKHSDNDYDVEELKDSLNAELGSTEELIARLFNICRTGDPIPQALLPAIERAMPNLVYFRSSYLVDFHVQRNDRQRKIHVSKLQGSPGTEQPSLFRLDGIWVLEKNKRVRHIETNRQQLLSFKEFQLDEYARLREGIDKSEEEVVQYVDSRVNVWPAQINLLPEVETRFFGFPDSSE